MTLILLSILLQSAVIDWQSETIGQSKSYAKHIDNNHEFALNTWALTEVFFAHCALQDTILSAIQDKDINQLFARNRACGAQDSKKNEVLLEAAFLKGDAELLSFYFTQSVESSDSLWLRFHNQWHSTLSEAEVMNVQEILERKPVSHFPLNPLIDLGKLISPNRSSFYTPEILGKAVEEWETQLALIKKNTLQYSVTLSNIIMAANVIYNDYAILKHGPDFLESPLFPNSLIKIKRINGIDFSNYIFGDYDRSLEVQRYHSLPLLEYLDETEEKNKVLLRHGAYLYALGKYQDAQITYQTLLNESDNYLSDYTLLNNLGISHLKLGHSNKYLALQLNALEQEIKNYKSLLNIYRNLFIYYSSVKDINSALNYIDKAKDIAKKNIDLEEMARIESFLGTFYWATYKDYTKSLHHFRLAEKTLVPNEHYEAYRDLLLGKAEIFLKIDSLNSAKQTLDQLIDISLSKSDTPGFLHANILLASYYLKRSELEQVEKVFKEIRMHSLDVLDFELLTRYHTLTASHLYKSGRAKEASAVLASVIDQIIERVKGNTDSQSGFWAIADEYIEAFELMIQLYTENDEPEKALVLLDKFKTINDASLYNSPLVKASRLSEADLAEEIRLNEQLQELRKKYLNESPDKRFALKIEIDRISAEREELLAKAKLNQESPLPPVWALQRALKTDELILHFTELGSWLYVTHLTASSIAIKKYELDNSIRTYLSDIANQLAKGETNLTHLYSIYNALELTTISPAINQITVIPDNYLYRIPLEILPTSQPHSAISYGSTSYLIEDYRFRYFTSLQEFYKNKRSRASSTPTDFSVFAISNFNDFNSADLPSLPFATAEATNISQVLSAFETKKIFTEKAATKQQFKHAVATSSIVHVATHSEISEQNPLFSTIFLKSESSAADTLESEQALYAYELFDTALNSDFIMLNSCSSGSGNYMQGTGIMGISRALRYAGAKSLALNLWPVHDKAASEFATDFYTFINQGYTKSEAVRLAKLNQLNSGNANPHFWGAYVMIGNPAPLTGKNEHSRMLYLALFSSIIATGYGARKYI